MAGLTFEHGGNIYEAKRRLGKEVIDFSANINPLGLPRYIRKLLSGNLGSILHYPDPDAKDLTKQIARYWGISEENVLVGNGSIELIYLIIAAFKPKTALIAAPDFSEYERALTTVRSRLRFLRLTEEEGFGLDLSRVKASDIFFFSNPHNPTGNIIVNSCDKIEKLPNKTVVVDEAFMDFADYEEKYTMIKKATRLKNIIVLRTFTKFFALPGLRIGYLIAHKDIIGMLKRYQAPWSVNSLAQIVAGSILNDATYMNKTRYLIKKERDFLSREIAKIDGLKPFLSEVNFILVKIEKKEVTSRRLTERLLQKGILIRDCGNFRSLSNRFIRIAVRKRSENQKLVEAIKNILMR